MQMYNKKKKKTLKNAKNSCETDFRANTVSCEASLAALYRIIFRMKSSMAYLR